MNEEILNIQVRKFLKKVGITSQRAIEAKVNEAVSAGQLDGHEKLAATMTLRIAAIDLEVEINDIIDLG